MNQPITHWFSIVYDDGFIVSNTKIADIYEQFGLRASFFIIATGHWPTFKAPDPWHEGYPKGDFKLWNQLQARGHEIMPHGYKHAKKTEMPIAEAQKLITDCLHIFENELEGFQTQRSVFGFPNNASSPELEAWLSPQVRAVRSGGPGINPFPTAQTKRISTHCLGPDNCEADLDEHIEKWLAQKSGWLVYNGHGLEKEGWAPIGTDYLKRLLQRLTQIPGVGLGTVTQVLDSVGQS
jgi:peptidoglycan/xylan/chitin deacetylase (PgdA/CDA1 family)